MEGNEKKFDKFWNDGADSQDAASKQFDRVVITGVPMKNKRELERLAGKKGTTVSAWLKPKLIDIIEAETKRVFPRG